MKKLLFFAINLIALSSVSYANHYSMNRFTGDNLEHLTANLNQQHKISIDRLGELSQYLDQQSVRQISSTAQPATAHGWLIFSCQKDQLSKEKSCAMVKNQMIVAIINNTIRVTVGSNHFPQKSSTIKIDNNSKFFGEKGQFNQNDKILNQMIKGKIAYTRYMRYSETEYIDEELHLQGFAQAYRELKKQYNQL